MAGLEMKYFVLKPGGKSEYAAASRIGMRAYADAIRHVNPQLADELMTWVKEEHQQAAGAYAPKGD